MFEKQKEDFQFLKGLAIVVGAIGIVLVGVFAPRPEPKPIKFPTMESVGKKVGEKSTRFGKGFVKGVWQEVKPTSKGDNRAEQENTK